MLRDEFQEAKRGLKYASVFIPEWNRTIWCRTLSGVERDAFEASLIIDGKPSLYNIRAKFMVWSVCEGDGNPTLIFKPPDAEWLGDKAGSILAKIYDTAQSVQ
jgi:hypothetical protein